MREVPRCGRTSQLISSICSRPANELGWTLENHRVLAWNLAALAGRIRVMRHSLLLILLSALIAWAASAADPAEIPVTEDLILVELFTSQGCSSCPPADVLLGELGQRSDVVALSLHVDYWNNLGWSDPFSSAAFTERQRSYVHRLRSRTAYTPMLVVGGEAHCVGSQEDQVAALLMSAKSRPRAGRLRVSPTLHSGKLELEFDVTLHSANTKPLDLMVAIAENNLSTPVRRGENANRQLTNHHVVRRLEKVATVSGPAGESRYHFAVQLAGTWKKENLEAVAFLQDPTSLRIEGVARSAVVGPG